MHLSEMAIISPLPRLYRGRGAGGVRARPQYCTTAFPRRAYCFPNSQMNRGVVTM